MNRIAALRRLIYFFCLAATLFAVATSSSNAAVEEPTFAGPAQGTTYRVRLGEPLDVPALSAVRGEIDAILAGVDRQMSRYHSDTEVSQFNRSRSTDWLAVSPDLAAVVRAAIAIHDRSGGTFDITVAPLVDLWGFGPRGGMGHVPPADEIARVRHSVGSELIAVRVDPPALRKTRPEVALDLNGIAPGFAVDRIARALERRGVTNYLIRLDGHIRARGHAFDGRPWRVGIDRPTEIPSGVQLALEPGDAALSTSGDYRHYFLQDGHRYSHIIDPRTGRPIAHAATSVSIVAGDCLTADAWAKALMVLGPIDGVRLANERGIAAYYVVRRAGEGGETRETDFRAIASREFARRFFSAGLGLDHDALRPTATEAVEPPTANQERLAGAIHIASLRWTTLAIVVAFAIAAALVAWRRRSGPAASATESRCTASPKRKRGSH
ncbi:MAG TPA: FAD:protein FMN transferase [Pirellulales bacterium]|nr:FAD:protein FMN transferase [Pirellulales bacterium]